MKYSKYISILVIFIVALSLLACLWGIITNSNEKLGEYDFKSIRGETIKINGSGLYRYESADQKLSLKVHDPITLFLGVPLLIISLILALKRNIKGRLLLTGTLGYFLYTYISYAFLRMYNELFLVYVMLMSASTIAFILCMMSFDIEKFCSYVKPKMPIRFIGGYQILLAAGLMTTWLPGIMDSLANGNPPIDLDHYNSLGYEALDLGFIVPALIISAILVLKRKPLGYLLSSVIIMLSISMNLLISVLTVFQVLDGMEMPILLMVMFPIFTVITGICLGMLLRNIKEPSNSI
ncbi:hypothetical protein [Pseudobacteroides cellulosolvens]|uniref:Uncharacterized protein n=1 Tax=Pseudobacteroides cellulosolvens ATCC 35603 = DSM 2933 TaxID=398512 RepID=A0A0L6JU32_9FIRM|nr:hypothetical protein [Pseudobacteroides cellulosolvens]KNY29323.1 hypothetical protein Bccel_4597 [Pseudobacteroides cellulosolvens ATCC 35603 = DSM 2933]